MVDDDSQLVKPRHSPGVHQPSAWFLDGADGLTAAVVIAGAEADYEQLGITNFILIQRIAR